MIENNYRNDTEFNKLPILIDNKAKKSKYLLSHNNNTIHSDDINENNSDFCDFENEKKLFKEHILNSDNKYKKNKQNKNIIKDYKDILDKEKEKINKTKKDNNNIIITNSNYNSKNKKNIINKAISLSNTNDATNISNSTTVQAKNAKANVIINNKKRESNNNLLIKSKSNQQSQRLNTFLKNNNKNKINALFEDTSNKLRVVSNNDDNSSSNLSQNSSKKQFSKDSNKDLSRIGEENLNSYKRDKYTKLNKNKKIGSNIYDFII